MSFLFQKCRNHGFSRRDKQGQTKAVVELLRAGAHPSAANDDKESPLALAAKNGHEDVLVLLLDTEVRRSHLPGEAFGCIRSSVRANVYVR